MKKAINIFTIFLLFIPIVATTSCFSTKEIPINTVEKLVYKDTVIYIHDSIKIPVPYETVEKESYCTDTSHLKTSLAESIAYVDTTTNKLHHTLTQDGELEVIHDTIIRVEYVDRVVYKDVPVEVEVIKYKRDALFWCLLAWAVLCLTAVGMKLFIFK